MVVCSEEHGSSANSHIFKKSIYVDSEEWVKNIAQVVEACGLRLRLRLRRQKHHHKITSHDLLLCKCDSMVRPLSTRMKFMFIKQITAAASRGYLPSHFREDLNEYSSDL
jgi:hypothetical protein